MKDILIMEKCICCNANLTLMESCRGEDKDDEVLTNSYLVTRCLQCEAHEVKEVARLNDNQSDLQ